MHPPLLNCQSCLKLFDVALNMWLPRPMLWTLCLECFLDLISTSFKTLSTIIWISPSLSLTNPTLTKPSSERTCFPILLLSSSSFFFACRKRLHSLCASSSEYAIQSFLSDSKSWFTLARLSRPSLWTFCSLPSQYWVFILLFSLFVQFTIELRLCFFQMPLILHKTSLVFIFSAPGFALLWPDFRGLLFGSPTTFFSNN